MKKIKKYLASEIADEIAKYIVQQARLDHATITRSLIQDRMREVLWSPAFRQSKAPTYPTVKARVNAYVHPKYDVLDGDVASAWWKGGIGEGKRERLNPHAKAPSYVGEPYAELDTRPDKWWEDVQLAQGVL